eukprot:1374512-Ditylum_brightwellii.AAC.1
MKIDDGAGGATNLLAMQCFQTYFVLGLIMLHSMHEKYYKEHKDDWQTIQVGFLGAAEKNLSINHDKSSMFRTASH